MRVCIDARAGGGWAGGVEMLIIGLAQGFSQLTDGDEQYFFFTNPNSADWLEPYLGGNCHLLPSHPMKPSKQRNVFQRSAGRVRYFLQKTHDKRVAKTLASQMQAPDGVSGSNGRIEAANIDIVHFTLQEAFATEVPFIYHPHDLQHRHFPEFFKPEEIAWRDTVYRYFCEKAQLVSTVSSWVKKDVVEAYGLSQKKVAVVPFAPPNLGYQEPSSTDLAQTVKKFALPSSFAFYPAQTWPHKNHIRLIEAAARAKDNGASDINLVFSGQRNDHYPAIAAKVAELGMEARVKFVGFVSPIELQSLYRLARCVVVPSLHEAASFPIWEAFVAGVPVLCSSVTSLPEQVGPAAVLFDPLYTEEMSDALLRVWSDDELRNELIAEGHERVHQLTWLRTCKQFRAHYRAILKKPLVNEDRELLSAPAVL